MPGVSSVRSTWPSVVSRTTRWLVSSSATATDGKEPAGPGWGNGPAVVLGAVDAVVLGAVEAVVLVVFDRVVVVTPGVGIPSTRSSTRSARAEVATTSVGTRPRPSIHAAVRRRRRARPLV